MAPIETVTSTPLEQGCQSLMKMEDFLIKLFAEAPLAAALAYGARLLAPLLAEHLKQQRSVLEQFPAVVQGMGNRLTRIEDRLGIGEADDGAAG